MLSSLPPVGTRIARVSTCNCVDCLKNVGELGTITEHLTNQNAYVLFDGDSYAMATGLESIRLA